MSDKIAKEENSNHKFHQGENQVPKSPQTQKASNRNRINQEHFIKESDRVSSQPQQDAPLSLSTDIIRMSGPLLVVDHGARHLNSEIKISKIQNAQFVTVKIPEGIPVQPASPTFFIDQNNPFSQEPFPAQHHNQQHQKSSNQQEKNQGQNEEQQKELTPRKHSQQQILYNQDIQKNQQAPSSTPPRQLRRKVSSKELPNQQQKGSEKVIPQSEQEQGAASKCIQQQQYKQKINVFKDVILQQKEKVMQEQKKQENTKIKESPVKTPKKNNLKSPMQLLEQGQDGQAQNSNINKVIPQKKDIGQNIFSIESPWRAEQAKIMAQYQYSPAILLKRREQSRSKSPLQNQKESPLVQKKSNEQELQQKQQNIEQKSPLNSRNSIEPKSPHQQRKSVNEPKSPLNLQPKGGKAPNLSKDVIVVVHKKAITPELNQVYKNKANPNNVNTKESKNEQLEMIKKLVQEKKSKEGQEQYQQNGEQQQVQMANQIRDSTSKWDIKEKEVLMKLVEVYGQNEWNQISKHIPNRTPDSCKDMFHKLNSL